MYRNLNRAYPQLENVLYTVADIKGIFVDFFSNTLFSDCMIEKHVWVTHEMYPVALVSNRVTKVQQYFRVNASSLQVEPVVLEV